MSSNEEDAGNDVHDAIEVSSADEIAVCSPAGSPRSASGSAKVVTADLGNEEEEGQEADVLERQAAEEERLLSAAAESHIPEQLLDAMDLSGLRGTKAPPGEAGAKKKKDGGGGGGGEKEDGKMASSPGDGARARPQAAAGAGAAAAAAGASPQARPKKDDDDDDDDGRSSTEEDLENLAELVPGLKTKQDEIVHSSAGGEESPGGNNSHNKNATDATTGDDTAAAAAAAAEGDDTVGSLPQTPPANIPIRSQRTGGEDAARWSTKPNVPSSEIRNVDSMVVMSSNDEGDDGEGGDGSEAAAAVAMARIKDVALRNDGSSSGASSSSSSESSEASDSSMETMQKDGDEGEEQELQGFEAAVGGGDGDDKAAAGAAAAATRARRSPDSDAKRPSKKSSDRDRKPPAAHDFEVGEYRPGKEPQMPGGLDNADYGNVGMSSGASLSTATQTHEVRMPMYLPTFKPATGCTNASDFIVRCFVARLRSGITVVKHGRSRWCKSRLRILHVHSDGRSLSWKPALGEPSSSKRPPKLDLSTCTEVRHAWSPDPLNPMFTGTPILRQKCEAANAHKSFALIFPKRTVDITAITADQCKVLMEGFSALCFRLQVANLAGRGKRGEGEEDRQTVKSDTVSNTNTSATNKSTNISPSDGGKRSKGRR